MHEIKEVIVTPRLALRKLQLDDGLFIVELLNDSAFVRHIGDKRVRTVDDAHEYLRTGPFASYASNGFGLYLVESAVTREALGICGLIKRDSLPDVDLGFALLPQHRRHGYTFEAAAAVLHHGRTVFGLTRVVAVVSPGNRDSIRVLEKLGMRFESRVRLAADGEELELYGRTLG